MEFFSFIIWGADPDIFVLFGRPIRWYGLLFALGFLISQQVMYYIHKKEGKPTEDVDTLTVYMIIATILGARLGHVFFYEPQRYLANPADIFKVWEGGLASHGAAIGILLALWIYSRYSIKFKNLSFKVKKQKRKNQSFLQVVDRIVIVVIMTGTLIRLGNFMNSEIYGHPTGSDYGVIYAHSIKESLKYNARLVEEVKVQKDLSGKPNHLNYPPILIKVIFSDRFPREDYVLYLDNTVNNLLGDYSYVTDHVYEPLDHNLEYEIQNINGKPTGVISTYGIPRHPTQLYESGAYAVIFIILLLLWKKWKIETPTGRIFAVFLVLVWGARFGIEFMKENQVAFEESIPLNMGQWLSIPLIITGIILWIYSSRKNPSLDN